MNQQLDDLIKSELSAIEEAVKAIEASAGALPDDKVDICLSPNDLDTLTELAKQKFSSKAQLKAAIVNGCDARELAERYARDELEMPGLRFDLFFDESENVGDRLKT